MAKKANYVLTYSLWNDLDNQTKDFFRDIFEIESRAKYFFEMYFYKLNIVHELSHALFHAYDIKHNMYDEEANVNRMAVAFFKENDPDYIEKIMPYVQRASNHMTKPDTKGLSLSDYFIKHYDEIGPIPSIYGYFQLIFVLNAYQSKDTLKDLFETLLHVKTTLKKPNVGVKADKDTPKAIYETWQKVLKLYGISAPKVKMVQAFTPAIQHMSW